MLQLSPQIIKYRRSYLKPLPALLDIVISQPWQQERARVPPNKKLRAAVLLLLTVALSRLKPTRIRPRDTDTVETHREHLGNSDLPKIPRACIVPRPEPGKAKHAREASPPEDEVALVLSAFHTIEAMVCRFVKVV